MTLICNIFKLTSMFLFYLYFFGGRGIAGGRRHAASSPTTSGCIISCVGKQSQAIASPIRLS